MKKNKKNVKSIFITAGGTGGHIFPAQVITKELKDKGLNSIFITDHRGIKFSDSKLFKKTYSIPAGGVRGKNIIIKLYNLTKIGIGFLKSIYLILKHRPKIIVGFGGYTTVPVIVAGKLLGCKTIIHSADSIFGLANSFLSKFSDTIAVSFKNTKNLPKNKNIVYTGLPLRKDMKKYKNNKYPTLSNTSKIHIFIMGGSQGAKILSQVIPDAFAMLDEKIKKRLNIIQQVQKADLTKVKAIYKKAKIECSIAPFFNDTAKIYSKTHLFLGRSGASTVLEIMHIGVPAIFIPLPHRDDQQLLNAKAICDKKAGKIILQKDFTSKRLYAILSENLTGSSKLKTMKNNFKLLNNDKAVKDLSSLIVSSTK